MAKKLKPSEKRKMREQLAETEQDIRRLQDRAVRHAGTWIGRDAEAKAADALVTAKILRMYVKA